MVIVYDAGFIAVFAVFVLLYLHAWRKRDRLDLNAVERFETVERIGANLCFAIVGALSLAIVLIGGNDYASWAGVVYYVIGPLLTVYHSIMRRKKRTHAEALAALNEAATQLEVPPPT
jgi:hypothetical protein